MQEPKTASLSLGNSEKSKTFVFSPFFNYAFKCIVFRKSERAQQLIQPRFRPKRTAASLPDFHSKWIVLKIL